MYTDTNKYTNLLKIIPKNIISIDHYILFFIKVELTARETIKNVDNQVSSSCSKEFKSTSKEKTITS